MIIDVGVLYRSVGVEALQALEIVVPARVVKQLDLSKEVLNNENARLIFGRHYTSGTDSELQLFGIGGVQVIAVSTVDRPSDLDLLTRRPSADLTALRVRLAGVLQSCPLYSRVRFVVDGGGSLWRWSRVLGRRSGATIDLRVHDPREGGSGANAPAEIHGRDLPIENLEAFFMLPERYQVSGQNPTLKYTRTLEGQRWRDYLRRGASGRIRPDTILVHRWSRSADDQGPAVDANHPFRGYLQFQRVPALHAATDLILYVVATVLLAYAVFENASPRKGIVNAANWLGSVGPVVYHYVLPAGITFAIVVTVLARARKLPAWAQNVKRGLKVFEYRWFKTFGY